MDSNGFRGIVVPILSPLTDAGKVDHPSLRRLVAYLLDNGVHGIWASGTSAEFASLTDGERIASIETVVDEVAGRVKVIANVSGPATEACVSLAQAVRESGVDGIAATPPYYYPHAQDEVLDHYRHIHDRVGPPLWVYNIPQTVGIAVAPSTVARLAGEGAVVGIKDSSGAGELLAELNILCEQGGIKLYRFLGTTLRITIAGAVGGHGVIPAIANLVPAVAARGWEAGEAGDRDTARRCDAMLMLATKIQGLANGGGPNSSVLSGLKSALKIMGVIDGDRVTRPMRNLTDDEKRNIPAILKELGLLN